MGFAVRRGFNTLDSAAAVRSVLPEWKKEGHKTAAKRKEALFSLLKEKLQGYPLKKAAAPEKGKPKADFLVAHDLAILLEHGLSSARRLSSVIRRLEAFRKWEGKVLLILTGDVEEDLRAKVDDWVNGMNNDREFVSEREIIVARY